MKYVILYKEIDTVASHCSAAYIRLCGPLSVTIALKTSFLHDYGTVQYDLVHYTRKMQ